MLTLSHITKDYGKFRAVEDISFDLGSGLYGMLAPNGAGKTTLLKMITTLLYPTEGEILYDGMEIGRMGAEYRGILGFLPQQFGYYRNQSPVRYLQYLGALKGLTRAECARRIPELLALVGLAESAKKPMRKFSGGMIQRVGIAQAMLGDPKLLVLDEPTAGLDPKERARFRNLIASLSRDRIVILSTHIVSDIESIANEVLMIRDKHLYRKATVEALCAELEGEVFETLVPDTELEEFSREYAILSERQEHGAMRVRFHAPGGGGERKHRAQSAAGEALAREAFAERAAAEGTHAGETSAERVSAEEAPAERASAEKTPAERGIPAGAEPVTPNLEDVFLVAYGGDGEEAAPDGGRAGEREAGERKAGSRKRGADGTDGGRAI